MNEGQSDAEWLRPKCMCGGDCHGEAERLTADLAAMEAQRDEARRNAEQYRREAIAWSDDPVAYPPLPWENA